MMRQTFADRTVGRGGGEVAGESAHAWVALAVVALTQAACISVPVRIPIQHLPDLDGLGTVANHRRTVSQAGRPIVVHRGSVLRVRTDNGAAFTSRFRSISVAPWGFDGIPEGTDFHLQIETARLRSVEVWRVSGGWTFLTIASVAASVALTAIGAAALYFASVCHGSCFSYY